MQVDLQLLQAVSGWVSPVCLIAGALWVGGRKDGDVSVLKVDVTHIKKVLDAQTKDDKDVAKLEGAQEVRNVQLGELIKEVRGLRGDVLVSITKFSEHEKLCDAREKEKTRRLDTMDSNITFLGASIHNLAQGSANRVQELSPFPKKEESR